MTGAQLPWWDRATRWAQLTLVDDDTRSGSGYSTDEWIDYIRDIKADAACLSAGGYLAFYPTEVADHRRSTHLGATDPFGDLVRGCRELGMVVMARVDPHAIHDEVFHKHPEWVARDAAGNPVPHWSAPGVWLTCPFGPWNQFISDVNREILTSYDVDAIFANRWAGSVRCFCVWCRDGFREATGLEIPELSGSPARGGRLPADERAYREWRDHSLLEIAQRWDREARDIRPDARFVPNSGGGVLSELDMNSLAAQVETLFADKQARSGLSPSWTAGRHGKEFLAVMGNKPVGGIVSVGIEERARWKDSVQTEEEIRMWVASATANGLRPWFTKFGGALVDRRWLPVIKSLYHWHAHNERYLRNTAPIADVGLVYSQRTASIYSRDEAIERVEAPISGWYQALTEDRVPFRMIHDRRFGADDLQGLRVLILPNIAVLDDQQVEELRDFVASGGALVATAETSLYYEDGSRREDFALGDLFGARVTGELRERVMNSYLQLHHDRDDSVHPILRDLRSTPRIINSETFVPTAPRADLDAIAPVTLVDSFPDLPMEEVYIRDRTEGTPQVYLSERGLGRVAYLPTALDRAFHSVLARDHFLLMAGIVEWARACERAVAVTGAGLIEVTAWHQRDSMTVFLVNHTNPMYLKGPVHELLPSPPQDVRIRIPQGSRVEMIRFLRASATPDYKIIDDQILMTVEGITDFEVIAVDLVANERDA